MKTIYVVVETVDLGGHAVKAYSNEVKANEVVNKLNEDFVIYKKADLVNSGYTVDGADAWIRNSPSVMQHFYVDAIELMED